MGSPETAAKAGGAGTVYVAIAAVVALRLLVSAWPSMSLWGLNTQRFVVLPIGLLVWVAMALPFVGRAGAWMSAILDRLGNQLARLLSF